MHVQGGVFGICKISTLLSKMLELAIYTPKDEASVDRKART